MTRSPLGANYLGKGRTSLLVWAPKAKSISLHSLSPDERMVGLEKFPRGYHGAIVENLYPGTRYLFRLDDRLERPDPASRSQPEGVHGPSEVLDPHFPWQDHCWTGLPLNRYLFYEIHVGTYTPEGTFDAIAPHLADLKELGITAIELMPPAQFPGDRNWGYDGVYPFAVQHTYGGARGLKRLVSACHAAGLAVVLDVVYNHLGPEGNYFGDYGPYFSDTYQTPWGAPMNFDGAFSDNVRRYFIENALYWITDFHIDALRLDAVHAILDFSAQPFLQQLAQAVTQRSQQLGRRVHLIAESALNDVRLIRPPALGGFGLDAQWNDDFHHALHTILTGETGGYYQDFGRFDQLVKSFSEGFAYTGQYSAYRKRSHGNRSAETPARRFVIFSQNHDQVGNRMSGERLSALVPFEALKLAAGIILLSPYLPLLFMGEEYGETAPFCYFTSHSDQDLINAVREGRRKEFSAFQWKGEPPEPQDPKTFLKAKTDLLLRKKTGKHRTLFEFYRELIRLRNENSALALLSKDCMEVAGIARDRVLCVRRWSIAEEVFAIFHLANQRIRTTIQVPRGRWYLKLDSNHPRWMGSGSDIASEVVSDDAVELALSPYALVVLTRRKDSD
jgi:maltooligosyltrehalose trehalohydrolase